MEIILVRHPETEANIQNLFYSEMDYPYTDRGQIEFKNIIKELRDLTYPVYSSPYDRALKVAQMISNNIVTDNRLKEMNFGDFKGRSINAVKTEFPDDYIKFKTDFYDYIFPNGESYPTFSNRIIDFFEEIIQIGRSVIIVSHGGVINLILQNYFDITDYWPKTGSIIKLKLELEDDI